MPLIEILYARSEPFDRERKQAFAQAAVEIFREVVGTPPGRLRLAFQHLQPDDTLELLTEAHTKPKVQGGDRG
jgi:hypothetical protein